MIVNKILSNKLENESTYAKNRSRVYKKSASRKLSASITNPESMMPIRSKRLLTKSIPRKESKCKMIASLRGRNFTSMMTAIIANKTKLAARTTRRYLSLMILGIGILE